MQRAALFRRERLFGVVNIVLGFICVISVICERHWVSVLAIDRVLLCEYSLAENAEVADECSRLHYFAEKDS